MADENLEFETVSSGEENNQQTEQIKEADINVNDLFKSFPPPEETPATPSAEEAKQTDESEGRESWVGNPLYYQTGDKQGQLRPTPLKSKQKTVAPPPPPKGMLITGNILLNLTDIVIPAVVSFGNNLAVKEDFEKVSRAELKLREEQLKEMRPIFDEVANYLKLHLHPLFILGIAVGSAYSNNLAIVKNKKAKEYLDSQKDATNEGPQ